MRRLSEKLGNQLEDLLVQPEARKKEARSGFLDSSPNSLKLLKWASALLDIQLNLNTVRQLAEKEIL